MTLDHSVVAPQTLGVDPHRLDVLLRRIRLEVEHGRLPSAQVAVARGGRLVACETWGDAEPSTRYVLQSVGRSIVAGAVWKLIGEGLLDVTEHVAAIIPEFAPNGKEEVTVEQVLTHTAGFPFAPLGYPKMLDRDQRLAAFGRWRLDYPPGSRFQFHLTSAAWLVAEIVERRTGLAFADYLRERIAVPLGLSSLELGVPLDRQAGTVALMTATDRTSDDQEPDPWGPWYLSDPRVLAAGEPSHALVATAADVALYFQALEHSGLWKPEAVAEGTRIRLTDHPHGEQIYGGGSNCRTSMGLFVTVAGPDAGSNLPSTGSPALFGSAGAAYQLGFMDPETGLSFACLSNGYPLAGYDHSRRGTALLTNIANLAADLTD
ncbi:MULTISPECIES: serine hydrolase domain-containing protein [Streptomyces]|uniref:Beta-lactamase n=1 Tax=Streptomyces sviceus (strain ATCC 29083 / DSM 924 / JCM 4929 / NBRC 13980 / NCIMB 11184 / NRRL 5439 / UC 5370) TaxID=463191 RepID=B5HPE8_STRX2|nr:MULTISPECIES: serine hydrolase domain-containing protein [Streptomyces]EDY54724.1 beta-lactamase [Streptomyces sviceus ATCC 29083]MYT10537.1 serine hydrolase [Streptomyces sp. SID5470]